MTGHRLPKGLSDDCGLRQSCLACAPAAEVSQLVIASREAFVLTAADSFGESFSQCSIKQARGLVVIGVGAAGRFGDYSVNDFFGVKILSGQA